MTNSLGEMSTAILDALSPTSGWPARTTTPALSTVTWLVAASLSGSIGCSLDFDRELDPRGDTCRKTGDRADTGASCDTGGDDASDTRMDATTDTDDADGGSDATDASDGTSDGASDAEVGDADGTVDAPDAGDASDDAGGEYDGPTGGSGIPPRLDLSSFDQHYVSPDGTDGADGTESDPWSVNAAEANAGPGDVVNFLSGTYTTRIDPPSGDSNAPVVFRSGDRHAARLERQGGNTVNVDVDGKSHVVIQGFAVHPAEARWIYIVNSDHVTVRDNELRRATMDGAGGHPFKIVDSSHVDVVNNVMHTTRKHDMLDWSGSDHLRIVGNFLAMSGHSVFGGDSTDDIVVRGNVFGNAVGRQGGMWKGTRALVEDNVFTNAFSSPGSAAAASKLFREAMIFRHNRLFRDWGAKIEMSMYDSAQTASDSRYYSNVFHDSTDRGYYDGEAHFIAGNGGRSGRGSIDNVEFQNNIYHDNGKDAADEQVVMQWLEGDDSLVFDTNFFGSSSASPRITVDDDRMSLSDAESAHPQFLQDNITGNRPEWVDGGSYDHRLASDSQLVDAGTHLTSAENSGSGTNIQVGDPHYFYDGWGMADESGDRVQVGDQIARIENVDGNTMTLDRSLDWSAGDPVGLPWGGSRPDVGVDENGGRKQVAVVQSDYVAQAGSDVDFDLDLTGIDAPAEICWQFGDGTGTCGADASHAYDELGGYGIRVRVRDADGFYHWGTTHLLVDDSSVDVDSFEYNKHLAREHLCNGEDDPYTGPDETELYQEDDGDWDCR